MDDITLKIAIAAFIHDIGKFADKVALGVTEQYINDNSNYLPFRNGRHSHHHAVYTAAFIEYLKKDLPYEFNSGEWGEGDTFINLAAGHHNPRTPMQQIVTVADRLTSGMDSDEFDNQLKPPMCPLCGKRPSEPETNYTLSTDQIGSVCRLCRDHVFIGTQLVKNGRIIITSKDAKISGNKNQLMEPVFGQYQLLFSSSDAKDPLDSEKIFKYWDISLYQDNAPPQDVSKKIINSYVPVFDKEDRENYQILLAAKSKAKQKEMIEEIHPEDPKTFNHIAVNALDKNEAGKISGVEALGALKADVDYLGMLMGCGLERQKYTISRLAALSRQLNYYFALYLPHLFITDKRFENIYYYPGTNLVLFVLIDENMTDIDQIRKGLENIGKFGFGRDASIGLGRFAVYESKEINVAVPKDANACYLLAPCVPEKNRFKKMYFTPFIRFGKHGDRLANAGNPFKNPVVMADEGAVFIPNDKGIFYKPYIGRAVTGVSKAEPCSVVQGYAPYLPLKLEH